LDRNAVDGIIAAVTVTPVVAAAAFPTAVAVVSGRMDDARSAIQSTKEATRGKEGRKEEE
jgi:hypothetical protein